MKIRAVALIQRFKAFAPATRTQLILVAIGLALLLFLLFARKPWTVEPPEVKPWKTAHFVTVYVWYALLADLAVIGVLAATARWWARPAVCAATETRRAVRGWLWATVIAAMALNTWLCWPRLGQSFWHDETYSIRHAIVGRYKAQEDGSLKLNRVKWRDTFYFYLRPNHTLYSGLGRAGNEVWRLITRPKGLQFSEVAVRLPAYLAGIASVATIALLLDYLGFSSAAAIAAFLTALHPWHIRYASEARAYAFVLMLAPLVIYFFLRALRSGKWKWWGAFGFSQFLLLYFYPTCAYVLAVLNLCAMPALWWQWGRTSEALTQWMRWAVTNVGAALLFLPAMLPCVPQFLEYVKGTPGQGQLNYEWMTNFLAHMLVGIPWAYLGHTEPDGIELYPWFAAHPGLGVLGIFLGVTFLAMGIRRLLAGDRVTALLPVVFLLPAVLCYADTKARGGYVYEWYLLFTLPGAVALVALGLDELLALSRTRTMKGIAWAGILILVGGYVLWTTPQRDFLRKRSVQPNRESVELTRPSLDPNDPRQKAVITATFYGPPEPYDPNIIIFSTAKELGDLVRRADAEGKALYINLGYLTTVEGEHPHKYELLKNSGFFEDLGLLSGFEPTMHSRHVFKYIPGKATNFDFASVPADRGRRGSYYSQ